MTLFHNNNGVDQCNASKTLSHLSKEFPDLSSEEILRQQEEIMRNIQTQAEGSARGKGRTRRGKKGRGKEGR